jgi:hypothetical protein
MRLGLVIGSLLCSLAARADTPMLSPEPFTVAKANRVDLAVDHHLTRDEAKKRVTELLSYWAERFGVKSEWHGFKVFLSGAVFGISIKALFDVGENTVLAMASDPGAVWRGTAENYVGKKLRKYLHLTYQEP